MSSVSGKRLIRQLQEKGETKKQVRTRLRRLAGKTLLQALLDHGLSQTDIAEAIGVTQASVSRQLSGHNTPGIPIITSLYILAQRKGIAVPEVELWEL